MGTQELNHNEKYQWVGTFWSSEQPDIRLSGKLEYDHRKGIRLDIITDLFDKTIGDNQKTINGYIISDKQLSPVTILNAASLNQDGVKINISGSADRASWRQLSFVASQIIFSSLSNCEGMELLVKYDTNFDSIFFTEKTLHALSRKELASEYSKYIINIEKVIYIKFEKRLFSLPIERFKSSDIKYNFQSLDQKSNIISQIEKALGSVLDKSNDTVQLCHLADYFIKFTNTNNEISDIYDLLKKQAIWLNFWKVIRRSEIIPTNMTLRIKRLHKKQNTIYYDDVSMLSCIDHDIHYAKHEIHYYHLPINIDGLIENRELNQLTPILSAWFRINTDEEWRPIISSLLLAITITYSNRCVTDIEYAQLIFSIGAFLSKQHKNSKISTLIKEFAYKDDAWKNHISSIFESVNIKDTTPDDSEKVGRLAHDIRSLIAHPPNWDNPEKKFEDKYKEDYPRANEILSSSLQLHNFYICIAALFINAIFNYLGINKDSIDRYITKYYDFRRKEITF